MKKNTSCPLVLIMLLLILASLLCIACSECFTANRASIIGGVLSAVATGLLGGIAFWQNKRYKELSDELNERAYMPEIYKADTLDEQLDSIGKSRYSHFFFIAQGDGESMVGIDCGHFMVINSPILNVSVKNIVCSDKSMSLEGKTFSIYGHDLGFSVSVKIPLDFTKYGTEFKITFSYENMYGTQYEKAAFFTLNEGATVAMKWKMDRARRAN